MSEENNIIAIAGFYVLTVSGSHTSEPWFVLGLKLSGKLRSDWAKTKGLRMTQRIIPYLGNAQLEILCRLHNKTLQVSRTILKVDL